MSRWQWPRSRSMRAVMVATLCMIGSGVAAQTAVNVDIAKFAFSPREVTVAPGTKVVWTNHDDTPHTIAANDKSFTSKGLDTDDRFEHTFAKEGDYAYLCTVHPFMTGVVHVRRR